MIEQVSRAPKDSRSHESFGDWRSLTLKETMTMTQIGAPLRLEILSTRHPW